MMTEREIYTSWKEAKDPNQQIRILLELNEISAIDVWSIIIRETARDKNPKYRLKSITHSIKDFEEIKKDNTSLGNFEYLASELDRVDKLIRVYEERYRLIASQLGA